MPQFSYVQPEAVNGQIAESGPKVIDSYLNPLLSQETDVLFATTPGNIPDGTYTVRIEGEEGVFEASVVASSDTATVVIDALVSAFGTSLLNVGTVSNSAPALKFVADHPGRVYTISFPSNPSTEMSVVPVQVAGGVTVPLGTVVVQGAGDRDATVPTGSSVTADALGITIRNTDSEVNSGIPTASDGLLPSSMLSVLKQGVVWVECEDAIAAHAPVFFRIQNAAAGGVEAIGKIRSDADGGDALQLLGAKTRSSTTGPGLVKVQVNRPTTA